MDVWPVPEDAIRAPQKRGYPKIHNPVGAWDYWTRKLSPAPPDSQELELLGSVKMDYCIKFYFREQSQSIMSIRDRFHFVNNKHIKVRDVSLCNQMYKHQNLWCNHTSPISSWSSSYPIQLPSGMFLICGDRAWPVIPSHIKAVHVSWEGSPC